eukprot:scaffold907_cov198-Chaetoceros_neogracile.AAC.15
MSSTSPEEISCMHLMKLVAIVIFVAIFFIPAFLFLAGPYFYFAFFQRKDLNKLYLAEGIRLSGSVLESHVTSGNCGRYTLYDVKVLYEAPGGGMYVFYCLLNGDKLAQTNIQLIILPQYPASAIPYFQVDPLGTIDRLTTGNTSMWHFVSFLWVLGNCHQLSKFLLSRVLLNVWAVALIIVCEVCISFVVGFFVVEKLQQLGYYDIEVGKATLYDESQEVQRPRWPMQITYREIFPHGTHTFCSILQSIVIDYLKLCVCVPLFLVLGIFLMIALGAGLWCICPIIDKRTRRQLSEQYITNGTIVEGKVVHRFALGWKARVQYAVTDISTSKILRYEKTIPGAHLIAGRQVQIPDDLRLYILHPDLPCSARFADEIELHDKTYEFNKWVKMAFYIVYLALQQSVCVWLLFYQFPTAAWSLSVISTCAIVLGVQLFMLWGFATLRSYLLRKDMVHNATQLFDVKSDINLKCSAVDNTLTLGDSTTTSEDRLDSEFPSPCRRFYQGEVMYDKVRPLD